MNTTLFLALLQAAAALLTGIQNNPKVSPAVAQSAVTIAGIAVQQTVQARAMAMAPFPTPENDGAAPNMRDLGNAVYLDANGNYVPLGGSTVGIIQDDTSFGDMNGDGSDDAATIVERMTASGTAQYALAVLLNQDGIMFNIADVPLFSGNASVPPFQVVGHNIIQGGNLVMNINPESSFSATSVTSTYRLVGDEIIKL
jgi:hypothetical protein